MKVILVGGGRVAYFLAKRFASKGYDVTIINRDKSQCKEFAESLDRAVIVHGDGSHPRILEESGARKADVLVALTPNDADNLLMCQLADCRFGVAKTLALVNDPDNEQVFQQLGITTAFSTTSIVGSLVEQRLATDDIINLIPIEEGRVSITEVTVPETAGAAGKSVQQLDLPKDSVVACIIRQDDILIPRGRTIIEAEDRVILISLPESLAAAIKVLESNVE